MASAAGSLLRQTLRQRWALYGLGALAVFVTSVSEALIPKFTQWSIEVITAAVAGTAPRPLPGVFAAASPKAILARLAVHLLLLLGVGFLGRFGWRQLLARQTHDAGRSLKLRFWDSLRDLPLPTFKDYPLGELMNRATGDWNAARVIHGFTLVMTLDLMFLTALCVGNMLAISVRLTCCCLAVFALVPPPILRFARREHDLHLRAQESLGRLTAAVAQALATTRLQRATGSGAPWLARLRRDARSYGEARFQVVRTGLRIFPLGALPTLVAYGVLLTVGVGMIERGELSLGGFVAMLSYVMMLQSPLFEMGDVIAEWQRGMASLSRLGEVFALEDLAKVERRAQSTFDLPPVGEPLIEMAKLRFAHPGGRLVLRDLSLTIRRGESVGIVGPIGAGKSTLLSLIAGLIPLDQTRIAGSLTIGGVPVQEVGRAWLSTQIAMVPQRAFLFAGTVRSNLELDRPVPDRELWTALAWVSLEQEVRGFSGGLDAAVGESGINLSGGQRQRLALARALLRPRPILLLDDCLSAVDAATEAAILAGLEVRLRDVTLLWVAHRASTLGACGRVLRLVDGSLRDLNPEDGDASSSLASHGQASDRAPEALW